MALDPAHQPQNGNGMAQYQVPLVVEKPGYNITKDRADHAEVEEFRTVASAYPMLNVPQAPPPREEPTTPPTLVEEPPAPEVTHNGNGNGAAHDGQPSASERRKLFKAQSAATTSASTLFGSTSFGTSKANNVFTFRDCRFTVKKKEILKGVSGQVRSGNVLAIMGPSGAGKTTLLNLLTLSNNNGECEGDVTLNGNTISTSILRRHCAYVAQEDHLWAFFTTRQCLDYVAALSLASPREDRDRIIDGLITRLGLKVCENTRVGNPFLKGLSGGQKRRLSLALALIKNPAVLFLDEPTSGLDSASAAEIMKFLGEIAVELDTIVICTIHQPSSTVFEAFDQTMVLSDGQVAYSGRAADCSEYFEGIGLPIPELHNPAEFMLDKVNKDWVDAAAVEKVLRHYKQTERAIPPVSQGTLPIPMEQADFFSQTITHVKRMFHNSFKDPTLWLSRVFINNIATIFFAVIYIKSRTRYQDMALPRMFMCMWTIGVPACMGIIAVGALSLEFFAVKREIKDGIYSCWSYLLANAIVQIPFIFLLSLCSIGISLYAMLDYDPAQFGLMLVLYAFALWSFEQFAQLCSILVKNFLIGMLIFVCIWFTSFLFAGFFNKAEDIPWPLRVFVYIFPLRWTISNMAKLEFDSDKTFGGAEPANNELGFTCLPGVEPCVGYTSQQVLKSIGQNFTLFQGERELGKDLGILLAIGITVKLFYCILFWFRTLDSKAPKKRS